MQVLPAHALPHPRVGSVVLLSLVLTTLAATPPLGAAEESAKPLLNGGRSRNVHRIGLYDADGKEIFPDEKGVGAAMSLTATCNRCHDVKNSANGVRHGWHFNAQDPSVKPGRPGEPWIYVDADSQTQIPLSLRTWPGTFRPQDIGLTDVKFLKAFGHHMPGGGVGDPYDDLPANFKDPKAKWEETGRAEIDCLICHSNTNLHEDHEWSRAIQGGNYREAAIVALGLGKRAEGASAPKPTTGEAAAKGPMFVYDKHRFDENSRVFFDITRTPSAERCYYCHSTRTVGPGAPAHYQNDGDVHIRAGMRCTDCHRNDMRHNIMRGYEGEPVAGHGGATLTCRSCHLGDTANASAALVLGGREGAPHPAHKGFPPLHFDRLACTACHSGPYPEKDARAVQTSMAHKLGIPSRTWNDTDLPLITSPVFLRDEINSNRIAPHKIVWPQYWGRLKDGKVTPLALDDIKSPIKKGLKAVKDKTPEGAPLTDAQIAAILAEFAKKSDFVDVVYVNRGKLFKLNKDGSVGSEAHSSALPYAWAIGHDVRPKAQSLGVKGCTECHLGDGIINAGNIASPVDTRASLLPVHTMAQLRGDDPGMLAVWAWSFSMRSLFKDFAYAATALLALMLLRFTLIGIGGLMKRLGE